MDKELKELLAQLTQQVKDGTKTIAEAKSEMEVKQKELEAKQGKDAEEIKKFGEQLEGIKKAIESFDALKTQIDGIEIALKRLGKAGPVNVLTDKELKRQEYDKRFRESLVDDSVGKKEMRDLEVKLLSTNSDPDGGVLVSSEIEAEVSRVANEVVSMRGICFVKTLNKARSWKKRVIKGGAAARWEGEGEQNTANTDTQTYAKLEIVPGKLVAKPLITQEGEEDAEGIIQDLNSELGIAFANAEALAFVSGNGINRPKGFLTATTVANASWAWGKLGYIVTGVSGGFPAVDASAETSPADVFIDLIAALPSKYYPNAVFVMNKATIARVRKFKNERADFIWQDSLQKGQPPMLFGYPVIEVSDMPAVGADSFSVAFGDFRAAYAIVDRAGMAMIRDPYSKKPDVEYCVTKRVGGDVVMYDAVKLLKFGTS